MFDKVVDLLSTRYGNEGGPEAKGYDSISRTGLQSCENPSRTGDKLWREMWENEMMKRKLYEKHKFKSEVRLSFNQIRYRDIIWNHGLDIFLLPFYALRNSYIKNFISLTSKVIEGHKRSYVFPGI